MPVIRATTDLFMLTGCTNTRFGEIVGVSIVTIGFLQVVGCITSLDIQSKLDCERVYPGSRKLQQ